jgi:hypothetical protein
METSKETNRNLLMKPRPFYRWKSFWLGILVLGFLGWAWVDSLRYESWITVQHVNVSNGGGALTLSNEFSFFPTEAVEWGRNDLKELSEVEVSAFVVPLFYFGGEPPNPEPSDVPDYWAYSLVTSDNVESTVSMPYREFIARRFQPPTDWGIFIPLWLVLLVFMILWSAWLLFHWKREQKKLA